ncbi:alpha/beta hydrolase-fold protein [Xylophilus sp. GW821-FHT01B05]
MTGRRRLAGAWLAALLLLPCLLAASASAQEPVSLPGTRQISFMAGPANDREYRLLVSEPAGKRVPRAGHPVLFVLDGNAHFAAFHDARRAQSAFAEAIVVGIGYPTTLPHDFLRRSYDFSPAVTPERNSPPQGGDDELLGTLERVIAELGQRYPIDPQQLSLFGHSFGGMFAMHALFTRPALFSHYVAASPSLWWNDHYLLAQEQAFARRVESGDWSPRHQSLLLIVGERETPQDIQELEALERRLQPLSRWGLRTARHLQPDEDHMSLPASIAPRVLRQVFTARRR